MLTLECVLLLTLECVLLLTLECVLLLTLECVLLLTLECVLLQIQLDTERTGARIMREIRDEYGPELLRMAEIARIEVYFLFLFFILFLFLIFNF